MLIQPAVATEVVEPHPTPVPEVFLHQGKYLCGAWLAGPGPLSLHQIRNAVCAYYGVSVQDVISDRRTARVVRARHVMFYLSKMLTTCSLPKIGRFLGGRDHTTVLHGLNKIAVLKHSDAQLAADIAAISKVLGGGS